MNTEKYASEFYYEVNSIVNQYIDRFRHLMWFGGADMAEAVRTLLKQHCCHDADHFVRCRLAGKTVEESLNRLIRCFELFTDKSIPVFPGYPQTPKVVVHPWEKVLREYEGAFIIHIHNESQVDRISVLNIPKDVNAILLCDTEVSDEIELPDNFAVLTLEWSSERAFENQFLETNFPYVYHCANAIEWIIRILHPSCVTSLADTSVSGCIVKALAIKHGFIYE